MWMLKESDIYFVNWEQFARDHTKYVKEGVNQREIISMKEYLVFMSNDFKQLNEEIVTDTVYPPPGIMKTTTYAEFHFKFELNEEFPKVSYLGYDLTEDN